jgi:hypothetical protein
MLTTEQLKDEISITLFDHEYTSWVRRVDFIWQEQEQHVVVSFSDMDGYDVVEQTTTDDFDDWLIDNGLELASIIDDLTWERVK